EQLTLALELRKRTLILGFGVREPDRGLEVVGAKPRHHDRDLVERSGGQVRDLAVDHLAVGERHRDLHLLEELMLRRELLGVQLRPTEAKRLRLGRAHDVLLHGAQVWTLVVDELLTPEEARRSLSRSWPGSPPPCRGISPTAPRGNYGCGC